MAAQALVNIDVDDLERAVSFYTQAFGLTVGRRLGPAVIELVGAGAPIFLLEKASGSAAVAGTGAHLRHYGRHWTPVHLDFVVNDVDGAVEAAVALGATLEGAAEDHAWGRIAQLADPFGHGLCIISFRGRGYDEIASG